MHAVRPSLRLWAWLALAATLGLALAPTVSRSLAAERMAPAQAAQADADHAHHAHHAHAADPGAATAPHAAGHHDGDAGATLDHCAMCALAASAWSLVPAAPTAAPGLLPVAGLAPLQAAPAPAGKPGWRPGRPRGPPSTAA